MLKLNRSESFHEQNVGNAAGKKLLVGLFVMADGRIGPPRWVDRAAASIVPAKTPPHLSVRVEEGDWS